MTNESKSGNLEYYVESWVSVMIANQGVVDRWTRLTSVRLHTSRSDPLRTQYSEPKSHQ